MYIVSHYGGEGAANLYHISERDERIGDFCFKHVGTYVYQDGRWHHPNEADWIICVAKMLADYLEHWECGVDEIITVDINEKKDLEYSQIMMLEKYKGDDYMLWIPDLPSKAVKEIESILMKYIDTGCSVRGTREQIAEELR